MRALVTAVAMGVMLVGCATVQDTAPSGDFAAFNVSRLSCVIGNNAEDGEHRSGYNGVFRITSPDESVTPYVPLYAGLNLEHYFDARPRSPEASVFFEPRHAPMAFRKVNDTTAELHQPETPTYGVESWTTFEVKEPYYIDMSYRCIPHRDAFQGGFMGMFWASYINAPHDKSIYFLQGESTVEKPVWAQLCTQKHGVHSSVRWQGDTAELHYPPEADTLFNSFSPFRFSAPFYYGRVRDMVLIYIFKPNPYLRFAHSPSGGGNTEAEDDTNPAWDFELVIPDWKVGETYSLTMRAVYKPWVDRADVLKEVAKYLNE